MNIFQQLLQIKTNNCVVFGYITIVKLWKQFDIFSTCQNMKRMGDV